MKNTPFLEKQFKFKPDFDGLNAVSIFASDFPIEPFLVFTEYKMSKAVFGPHPHAGISVMTYMLPDSQNTFLNRDSLGDVSVIEAGGLHITQAGSGMHHDEFPQKEGVEAHGFQIWINHTSENRFVAPKAIHANAHDIVEVVNERYKVRIVHGEFAGKQSPYQMVTKVTLLHVFLEPNQSIALDAKEMAFLYGLQGNATIGNSTLAPQKIACFQNSDTPLTIQAGEQGCEFMFGTGTPLHEPITYGGPFVMTTPEQMQQTQKHYAKGGMGSLKPY